MGTKKPADPIGRAGTWGSRGAQSGVVRVGTVLVMWIGVARFYNIDVIKRIFFLAWKHI
ncbi:MAG: hypothetical protein ABFS45_13285 [Pseudomonadota bacterium]